MRATSTDPDASEEESPAAGGGAGTQDDPYATGETFTLDDGEGGTVDVTIGDVMTEDANNCYIRSEGVLTAVVGLDDVGKVREFGIVGADLLPEGRSQ